MRVVRILVAVFALFIFTVGVVPDGVSSAPLVDVSADECDELEAAAEAAYELGDGRTWKRCQAIPLLPDGMKVTDIATTLDCAPVSIYQWAKQWRDGGLDGVSNHMRGAQRGHYHRSPARELRIAQIFALRSFGREWKQVAHELGCASHSGPLLLLRRALEEEEDEEQES
jgi:transposase-like protein